MKASAQVFTTAPDGGWGWVVVFGSFMIHVIADGVAFSFGIIYIELMDHFKESHSVTGWVGSLMLGITWGCGPLAGALTNRFGCRAVTIAGSFMSAFGFIISIWAPNIWFLYFSIGIIGGVGLGLIYLPAIVIVTYYFEKRRSFATGLAVCGSGVGTFVFAPLTAHLVEEYTWKGAILILAGLLLNCLLCGALFRPIEIKKASVSHRKETAEERTELKDGMVKIPMYLSEPALYKEIPEDENQKKYQLCSDDLKQGFQEVVGLLKNLPFLIYVTSVFLTGMSYCIPYMFLTDRAMLKGIDPQRAAFLISIIGIANTVGRVVFGWLSDRKFVNRLYLYSIALTICGTATSLSVFCETFELLCVYATVFGLFFGAFISLLSVLVVDLLNLECFPSAFGLTLFFEGIAGIIGVPIGSSLYDATGSYDMPFYIMGALIAISGIMLFCIPCIQRSHKHRDAVTQLYKTLTKESTNAKGRIE